MTNLELLHRIRLLEEALNASLAQHCKAGVLGPDSRCTPDWFVELAAVQANIQNIALKYQETTNET